MPSLGPAEVLVILVVALLVLGPSKMPEVGRQVARGIRELRRIQQHLSSELRDVVSEFDVDPEPRPGGDPAPTLPPLHDVEPVDHATNGRVDPVDRSETPAEADAGAAAPAPDAPEPDTVAGSERPVSPADPA
jgi:TatA/E family protein of Tat protein translocase